MVGLYLIGIVCAVIYALILKVTKFKGEPVPFVMELPNYRLPSAKRVMHLIWEEAMGFIRRAFTVILVGSVIQAAWIRRLESVNGADYRIYCKRERGINAYGFARW